METNRHRSTNSTADKPRTAAAARAVAGMRPKRFYREFAAMQAVPVEELVTLQMHLQAVAGPAVTGSALELLAVINRELQVRAGFSAGQSAEEVAGGVP